MNYQAFMQAGYNTLHNAFKSAFAYSNPFPDSTNDNEKYCLFLRKVKVIFQLAS
jgi:hypothetical protein